MSVGRILEEIWIKKDDMTSAWILSNDKIFYSMDLTNLGIDKKRIEIRCSGLNLLIDKDN
jgi:hypothetical protein